MFCIMAGKGAEHDRRAGRTTKSLSPNRTTKSHHQVASPSRITKSHLQIAPCKSQHQTALTNHTTKSHLPIAPPNRSPSRTSKSFTKSHYRKSLTKSHLQVARQVALPQVAPSNHSHSLACLTSRGGLRLSLVSDMAAFVH